MLSKFHKFTKGWLSWILVIGLAFIFLLWGVQGYIGGSSPGGQQKTITINGEQFNEISQRYFQQRFGDNYPFWLSLGKYLQQLGLNYNNQQINRDILAIPQFQTNGQYSQEKFAQAMQGNPELITAFRRSLQIGGLWQQAIYGLHLTSWPPSWQTARYFTLANQTRDIGIIRLDYTNYLDKVKVSTKDIKHYYNQHSQLFFTPEQVSINYIILSLSQLIDNTKISSAEAQQYYQQHRKQYIIPEQRRFQMIVINTKEKDAKSKIATTLKNIKQGPNLFNKLIDQSVNQQITGIAGSGLNWYQKTDLPFGLLADTIFNISTTGQTSKPVIYNDNWFIFKLVALKRPVPQTFDKAQPSITHILAERKAKQTFFHLKRELADKAFEDTNITDLAKQLNLSVQSSSLFSKQGGKQSITKNPKVIKAAFSKDILHNDYNSDLIELDSPQEIMVLHLKQHLPKQKQPLKTVTNIITQQLTINRAKQLSLVKAKDIAKQINSEKGSAKALAAKNKLPYITVPQLTIDNLDNQAAKLDLDRTTLLTALLLAKPANKSTTAKAKINQDKGAVVFIVNKITYPSFKELSLAQRESNSNMLKDMQILRNILVLFSNAQKYPA